MAPVEVLVVDSDPLARRATVDIAERAGFRVHVVGSAEEALYEHSHRDVDVVAAAADLAGIGCLELCRLLRERSQVPVIVLDRDASPATAVAALDAGADDVVDGLQLAALPARVRSLLRRRRGSLRPRREVRVGELVAVWTPAGRLRARDERFRLSPIESTVLEMLLERPGCVVPAELLRQRLVARHGAAAAPVLEEALRRLGATLARAGASSALQRVPNGGWLLAS